jgi:integrating conjugative element protein (TIGR03756 family)
MTLRFRRLVSLGAALVILSTGTSAFALDSATIASSALSPDCLAYRVVGICYWLYCTMFGCTVRTSVKVRHYVPDAVVSSYSNTGQNPWAEVAFMSAPNASAQAGGDGTTNQSHENNLAKFKNADVIGDPVTTAFNRFVSQFGYVCAGAGQPYVPYFLSTFDSLAWRDDIPEAVYPESLTPGVRDIGSRAALDLWGSVYPRGGFLFQTDGYKAAAVVAERAGDIVTREGQPHIYQSLLAQPSDGYWPAGPLMESDPSTGKWQELAPHLSMHCAVFPDGNALHQEALDGAYAWTLWRPYSCCEREGEVFLGSVDFSR